MLDYPLVYRAIDKSLEERRSLPEAEVGFEGKLSVNANQDQELLQRSKWNRNLTVKISLDILPLEDMVNEVPPK